MRQFKKFAANQTRTASMQGLYARYACLYARQRALNTGRQFRRLKPINLANCLEKLGGTTTKHKSRKPVQHSIGVMA